MSNLPFLCLFRYPQVPARDYGPPFMNKEPPFNQPLPQTIHSIQPQRHYQDIAPPGVDDDIAPPGVEEPPPFKRAPSEHKEREISPRNVVEKESVDNKRGADRKDRDRSTDRKRRHEKRSRTPDKARNPSPRRRSKSKERDSPDKHRRRRKDSSDREDKDRRRDHSDDEKSRRSKDKKKHKDKKDSEKKKKRDKKDKHKKDSKEKKPKEEFKQVIPKNAAESEEDAEGKRSLGEKKKVPEIEEERKLDDQRIYSIREEKLKEEKRVESEKRRKVAEEEKRKKDLEEEKIRKIVVERHETPEPEEPKPDLYGDMLSEEIDTNVMENYGKLEDENSLEERDDMQLHEVHETEDVIEEGEIKEFEDEEKDVLELHTTDIDLKTEVDKSDILAPVPEKSKWEVEEDGQIATSPKDSHKSDSKSDKSGKVTNEVLKRAENAIFAKAINAIRPIEIKKISTDRAKLYSGEREVEKNHNQIQVTVASAALDVKKTEPSHPPARLSVKERLGVKVEDTDRVINLSRNRSRTISPFSRRGESGRNYALGERRVEIDDFRGHRDRTRRSRSRRRENSRDRHRNRTDSRRQDNRRTDRRREHSSRKDDRTRHQEEDNKKSRRKRTRSRSESEDRKDKHKKKDKKQKKEKPKKTKDEEEQKDAKEDKEENKKPQLATVKRKPTIDEANFEPDYDLESHTDEEEEKDKKKDAKKHSEKDEDEKKSSTSDSESDSSSDDDRKKKKHKKHRKKKKKESSSSSSDSESESSDSERERKRKKHKKNKKKKKKSKHK